MGRVGRVASTRAAVSEETDGAAGTAGVLRVICQIPSVARGYGQAACFDGSQERSFGVTCARVVSSSKYPTKNHREKTRGIIESTPR